jgi:GNAT superfamily N-acetyltransferase
MKIIKISSDLSSTSSKYVTQAKIFVDEAFGRGTLHRQICDNTIHQWLIIDFDDDGNDTVVGYCSAEIKQEGLLGILKTSVVHPDFRKSGIGDLMVKHRIKWLQEQEVQTIKSYAWFVDGVVPAQKMLMNNNFKPWDDIRGWWSKDHNWDYPCSVCGSKCKCVARIFIYEE